MEGPIGHAREFFVFINRMAATQITLRPKPMKECKDCSGSGQIIRIEFGEKILVKCDNCEGSGGAAAVERMSRHGFSLLRKEAA